MSRFQIIDCPQRTEQWYAARLGRATSSRAADVLAKIKTGEAAARRDYRFDLALERWTGKSQEDSYISKEMQRGIDLEPAARAAYEAATGLLVRETGFLAMTEFMAGASLDGDVEDMKGITGFKCPKMATHARWARAARLPPEHVPQATHEMWVSGAEFYDFCSYDDRYPEGFQLFRVRVYRNEFDIDGYDKEIRRFLAEVTVELEDLKKMRVAA